MNQNEGKVPRQFDLSGAKIIDSFRSREVQLRLFLLAFLSVSYWYWMGDPIFLYTMVAYMAGLSVYMEVLKRLPSKVKWPTVSLILLLCACSFAIFMSSSVILWATDARLTQTLGLMLWFGAMLNTISNRAIEPLFLVSDMIVLLLSGIVLVVIEAMRSPDLETTLVIVTSFVALALYHLQAVTGIARFRGRIKQLRQGEEEADRQRAIGQLVGGVAHDFNNLLTVVIGNLQLHREIQNPDEQRELRDEAERAARRGADLTGQLLAFSRKSQLLPTPTGTQEIVADVKPLVERLLGEKHTLRFDLAPRTPDIEVDLAKLQAVLINLILNARDAMPDGGTIVFRATASQALKKPSLSIKISDKGTGIPSEILDQVFEPYFTTKPVGKGSGLGLSMAKGFAEQSGGRIELTSKEKHGTLVSLHFPAYVAKAESIT